MRGGSRAADRNEPAYLFEQRGHGESGSGDKNPGQSELGIWWKRMVVCGDDFGMNTAVDAGMLHLALMGRLSAISSLTQGLAFAAHGPELRALDLDLGVHLNLTEPLGLAAQAPVMPLRLLIARAYAN
ncbi:MAG TPA: ChbG/HpnK family deacetylase, partial [Bordetella sp.]|nr:ChbG/HpnK family deacetylase [Bordetella sp.]